MRGVIYLIIAATVLVVAAVLALVYRPVYRDAEMCAPDLESGQTIVIVDKTDPWNDNQAKMLETAIWGLVANKMKTEERLVIFTFGEDFQTGFPPLFSRCKPPSGKEMDDIVQSREYYNRNYKKEFVDPLAEVLENVKKAQNQRCSPIIEALVDILKRQTIVDHPGTNTVVMFSDMAQNSTNFSILHEGSCFERPASSPANNKVGPGSAAAKGTAARDDMERILQFIEWNKGKLHKPGDQTPIPAIIYQVTPVNRQLEWVKRSARAKSEQLLKLLGIEVVRWWDF